MPLSEQATAISPANRSLRDALANREAERAQERVTRLAEANQAAWGMVRAIGTAKREADLKIAEAEAETKRLVGDSTAARIMQEAQAEKAKQEEAIRKKLEADRLAQLKREYRAICLTFGYIFSRLLPTDTLTTATQDAPALFHWPR